MRADAAVTMNVGIDSGMSNKVDSMDFQLSCCIYSFWYVSTGLQKPTQVSDQQ
jgi:hypothetical protein